MGSANKATAKSRAAVVCHTRARLGSAPRVHQEKPANAKQRARRGQAAQAGIARNVNPRLGGNFDDFLAEEGILADARATANKRVIAYQIQQLMRSQKVSKTKMAGRMGTSRAALDRLLDPDSASVTLLTLERAAVALNRRVEVQLVEHDDELG